MLERIIYDLEQIVRDETNDNNNDDAGESEWN